MQSMTGFGSAQANGEPGNVVIEIKTVNSRYIDMQCRLPDELRLAEMPLRELVARHITRGKVELRASFTRAVSATQTQLSDAALERIGQAYEQIQRKLPYVTPLSVTDVLQWPDPDKVSADPAAWVPVCISAGQAAIEQLIQTRQREGERLVSILMAQADNAESLVKYLVQKLPTLMQIQQERLRRRLRDALDQACPEGLSHISGAEISERIAVEASAFSLKADVAEELDRLGLHLAELRSVLRGEQQSNKSTKGHGKRLDFLFQEMNREANTLGSKAVHMDLTNASMELKLLIEQMREQIQNIE